MARGKQLDNQTVYNIMLSYTSTNNFSKTAKELNLPISTVNDIYNKNKDKEEFVKLRNEKQEEFADTATKIIEKGLKLIDRRITTALDKEEEIERLLSELTTEDINDKTKTALYNKIKHLELQRLSEITTAVGTLYDKRALARGESTENTAIIVKLDNNTEDWAK